jgi:hypothetical protein
MGDSFEHSESGNWNLSSPYVEALARMFIEASQYKEISKFGFTDILLDLNTNDKDKIQIRIRGFQKYIYKLKDIIMWSYFAMKSSGLKDKFKEYHTDLESIEKESIPNIITKEPNGTSFKQVINEELFDLIYEKVEEIDMKMREPMNQVDLIFMHKETFDPIEYKKKIAESFKEGM